MKPIAKQGDRVVGTDVHLVIPEGGGSPVPVPLPFDGELDAEFSPNVLAEHRPVAVVGSVATQRPGHVVAPKSFAKQPSNQGRVVVGAATVLVNHKPIARAGDACETCNDPVDARTAAIVASGTVVSG
jgi:uncharacterized Zn-binding protein involved in type VI secretion